MRKFSQKEEETSQSDEEDERFKVIGWCDANPGTERGGPYLQNSLVRWQFRVVVLDGERAETTIRRADLA